MNPKALLLFAALGLGEWGCVNDPSLIHKISLQVQDNSNASPLPNTKVVLLRDDKKNGLLTRIDSAITDIDGLVRFNIKTDVSNQFYAETYPNNGLHNNNLHYHSSHNIKPFITGTELYLDFDEELSSKIIKLSRIGFIQVGLYNRADLDTIENVIVNSGGLIATDISITRLWNDTSICLPGIAGNDNLLCFRYYSDGIQTTRYYRTQSVKERDTIQHTIIY